MALANDSILVTPGSGATVATHLANGKEYQAIMLADVDGHVQYSKNAYFYSIPSQVHVAVANTIHWDLFNAHASLLVRIFSIAQLPNVTTAVTGVVFDWTLTRTTNVGTSGVEQTAWLPDLSQTALDAAITCRSKPTGGAASGVNLKNYSINAEETTVATQLYAALSGGGAVDLVPMMLKDSRAGILLRQNQGIKVVQVTNSAAGNTGWLIGFTVE